MSLPARVRVVRRVLCETVWFGTTDDITSEQKLVVFKGQHLEPYMPTLRKQN